MCLPIIAAYFVLDWRHRLATPLTTLLVYGGATMFFTVSTDGWYFFYSFTLLLSEPVSETLLPFWELVKSFIVPNILIATILTMLLFLLWLTRNSKDKLFFWSVVLVSTILTSYAGKAKEGGVSNALIPTFAMFSILLGVSIPEIMSMFQFLPERYREFIEIGLCLLVIFQMSQVLYKPWLHAPTPENYLDGDRALQVVKKFDGHVYVPNTAISLMAGKSTFAHPSAVWEVVHSRGKSKGKDLLEKSIQNAIDTQLFDAVVVFPYIDFLPDLQKYYILDKSKYILVDENWHQKADVYVLP